MKKYILLGVVALFGFISVAQADGYDLAVKNSKNLPAFNGGSASGDKVPVFDASDDKWKTGDYLPNRVDIAICGDGTTINNNTIYYGPSMVPVAGAGRVCDITQAGNATEATADTPALDNTAIQVVGMDCLTANPGTAGVTFALRNAAAATVPSVTCSVANTKLGCTAGIQTTTAIAAGAPIAIAASSTGDQGSTPFSCIIHAIY